MKFAKLTRRGYIVRCSHGLTFYWNKDQATYYGTCGVDSNERKEVIPVRLVPYRKVTNAKQTK